MGHPCIRRDYVYYLVLRLLFGLPIDAKTSVGMIIDNINKYIVETMIVYSAYSKS